MNNVRRSFMCNRSVSRPSSNTRKMVMGVGTQERALIIPAMTKSYMPYEKTQFIGNTYPPVRS
jgi:hypothetical protein